MPRTRKGSNPASCPDRRRFWSPLGKLLEEYPDLPARTITQSLDLAGAAATALDPAVSPVEIAAATRDLLDLARDRASAAQRRVGRELPVSGAGASLPCRHCRAPIAPGSFGYGSPAQQLLFASCPSCRGQMTLLTATWQRLSGLATTGLATS